MRQLSYKVFGCLVELITIVAIDLDRDGRQREQSEHRVRRPVVGVVECASTVAALKNSHSAGFTAQIAAVRAGFQPATEQKCPVAAIDQPKTPPVRC